LTIDINIVNGKLFLPEKGFLEGGVAIENGRIVKLGKEPHLPKASERIDAKEGLVLPGLIDIHVHMRDLEQKYKETMESGTQAAIAGGVTTVIDMPNNKPPTDSPKRVKDKKRIITGKAAANIGFYSLLPQKKELIAPLANEGIFGYKIYPAAPHYIKKQDQHLRKLLQEIKASTPLPLIIHPDNPYADKNEKKLFQSNLSEIEAFIKAHNQLDEAQAIEDFISLNEKIATRLHFAHVTAKESVAILREKKEEKAISAEVCPHHLLLDVPVLKRLKAEAKCLPPVRTKADQKALWEALNENIIKIVATDHAPHSFKEKHDDFQGAAAGIHGLETLLPLMFTSALKGKITLEKLIPKMTQNPASWAKIPGRGVLQEGFYADITIVRRKKGKIKPEEFVSKAKWSPFDGYQTSVEPWMVIVNGIIAKNEEHIITKAKAGKIITPEIKIAQKDEE
jgi:dihydroorotase